MAECMAHGRHRDPALEPGPVPAREALVSAHQGNGRDPGHAHPTSSAMRRSREPVPPGFRAELGTSPQLLSPERLLNLQCLVGNAAVTQILRPVLLNRRTVPPVAKIAPRPHHPANSGRAHQSQALDLLPTRSSRDQRAAASAIVVQRDVGFEFQTTWGIQEVAGRRGPFGRMGIGPKQYRQYARQELVRAFPGFNLTADEANTNLGAEIEFVVPHLLESKRTDMLMALARLEELAEKLDRRRGEGRFSLDKATGNPNDNSVEVYPKIKAPGRLRANPQLTGGIRMDKIPTLFAELSNKPADKHAAARYALVGGGGGGGLGNASTAVANLTRKDGVPTSPQCKGLVALIISYLMMGRQDAGGEMVQPTLNYGKASLTVLARTDFRKMFELLPPLEQQYFRKRPTERFVEWVLELSGNLAADNNVIDRGIQGNAVPVTRRKWLWHIARDTDLLKKETDARLFGYGELGSKVDDVGPLLGYKGAVIEFRTMSRDVEWTKWWQLGMRLFDFIQEKVNA